MSGYKVLIADDDPMMVSILSAALTTRGHAVSVAKDAMQAVMFAVKQQPNVVLLDVNMPAGTGIGALKRLKASDRTSSIPVVVISGSTDATLPATVRADGARAFFRKPVDLEKLCVQLEELMKQGPEKTAPTSPAT
jgi:CheY-like chemotaxis protein